MKTIYTLSVETDDHYGNDEFNKEEIRKKPTILSWYTKDSKGVYCEDNKYIKYFHMPKTRHVKFDLNKTNENDVYKPGFLLTENINDILKWTMLHSKNQDGKSTWPDAEFICYRGLLTALLTTPYERSNSLLVYCVKIHDCIYMCQFPSEQNKIEYEKQQTEEMLKFSRYGFKFEQFFLSDDPEKDPDPNVAVNEFEETDVVFNRCIGTNKILFGAEVDGLPARKDILQQLHQAKFVELKTSKRPNSEYSFKRYKLLKWWAQSWLVDVEKIIAGFRTDDGIVDELKEFPVKDIPGLVRGLWSDESCIEFLIDFLNFVKYAMKNAKEDEVYEFLSNPQTDVIGKKLEDGNKINFMPDWYLHWLSSIQS